MKLPAQVNICGIAWKVVVVEDPRLVDKDGGQKLWGQSRCSDHELRIYGGTTPDQQWATFLHELTHAILDGVMGVDKDRPEQEVTTFANILADTLIRNGLVKP